MLSPPALTAVVLVAVAALGGCTRGRAPEIVVEASSAASGPEQDVLRVTGVVQALNAKSIRVPQISAQSSRVTLVHLIPNGRRVEKDDVLVEFDRTALLDEAVEVEARIQDLGHQIEEKQAQIRNEAAKRTSQIREAEADLQKALLQLRKGPVLSEIDRLKNQERAESAKARVESLRKSGAARELAETASVKVLELKRQRQQVTLERIRSNLDRLVIRAPQGGMIAHENTWRSGSMGPPQEGDQMWPGQPVLRIFDPSSMVVEASVNEPDLAALQPAAHAVLYLDAYPGAGFEAQLVSASPVATAGLDSPVRTFSARFRVLSSDPRLLPDLSAALELPKRRDRATTAAKPSERGTAR
ncbi:MAG TPA: efflux RND transporter periplasmic adaptor subunit [Bryobacteraceae bacterium]|nr:efflux RND transporter periplasmic adaptor subunit [Bryobacteraceae bacterium]